MITLSLIRHGQSTANVDANIYRTTPSHQIPLTSLGKQQALDLDLSESKATCILYSPFDRAVDTALLINHKLRLPSYEDPLLGEQELAHSYDMLHTHSYRSQSCLDFGEFYFKEHGRESMFDVYKRARSFLLDVKTGRYGAHTDIIVVTHGVFINACIVASSIEASSSYDLPNMDILHNCSITTLRI